MMCFAEIPGCHELNFFFGTRALEHQVSCAAAERKCVEKRFFQIHLTFIHGSIANRTFHVLLFR